MMDGLAFLCQLDWASILPFDFPNLLMFSLKVKPVGWFLLQLNLTAGEDVEIEDEVDGWFYVSIWN
jgi:hypothetical protein